MGIEPPVRQRPTGGVRRGAHRRASRPRTVDGSPHTVHVPQLRQSSFAREAGTPAARPARSLKGMGKWSRAISGGSSPTWSPPSTRAPARFARRALRDLVEHLVTQGVHGLSPLGSTGEFAYLTFEQRREIVEIVVDAAGGRVPVTPGVAAFSTAEAVRQAKAYLEMGASGLVLILQTMFPLSQGGIESYFRERGQLGGLPHHPVHQPGGRHRRPFYRHSGPAEPRAQYPVHQGRIGQHRPPAHTHQPRWRSESGSSAHRPTSLSLCSNWEGLAGWRALPACCPASR